MSSYTRQSAADIVSGEVIRAAPLNAEFNQLQIAFSETTGHKHDGTTGGGALIPLISDIDNDTYISVEATADADAQEYFVAGTKVYTLTVTGFQPTTGVAIDFGTTAVPARALIANQAELGNLSVSSGATLSGTITLTTGSVLDLTGVTLAALTVGTLTVATAATISGLTATAASLISPSISGTVTSLTVTNLVASTAVITQADITTLTVGTLAVTSAASFNNLPLTAVGTGANDTDAANRGWVNSRLNSVLDLETTTTTTATIATAASVNFVLAENLGIAPGAHLIITATADNWVFGEVTSYTTATQTVTLQVTRTEGSGTYAGWTVNVSGVAGPAVETAPLIEEVREYAYFFGSTM